MSETMVEVASLMLSVPPECGACPLEQRGIDVRRCMGVLYIGGEARGITDADVWDREVAHKPIRPKWCPLMVEETPKRHIDMRDKQVFGGGEWKMNREIKFRGKTQIDGTWMYGSFVGVEENIIVAGDRKAMAVDPATVGQYTGLKDGEGVEIFEGDIVSVGVDCAGEVVYRASVAAFMLRFSDSDYENLEVYETTRVVGNIHEGVGK